MIHWTDYIENENLTREDIIKIPSRSCYLHKGEFIQFKENGWENKKLSIQLNYSIEDLSNEDIWVNPYESLQFDKNYFNALPYQKYHYFNFDVGYNMIVNDFGIYRTLIMFSNLKQLFKVIEKEGKRHQNEHKFNSTKIEKNRYIVKYEPYPFKRKLSLGHECHYTKGIIEAIFYVKNRTGYFVKELFCSAQIDKMMSFFYNDLKLLYSIEDCKYYKNGNIVAKKKIINSEYILNYHGYSVDFEAFEAFLFLEDITYKGEIIFRKGEIFNAPYCCFYIDIGTINLFSLAKNLYLNTFRSNKLLITQLKRQVEVSRIKALEASSALHQIKEHDKLKDEFLENTAHEIRTPLAGIIGLTESLKDMSIQDNINLYKNNIDAIHNSSTRLSILVNDILDNNLLKNEKLELNLIKVNIKDIVDTIIYNFSPNIKNRNIVIHNDLERDHTNVIVDENRIMQVFYNIINNSIKYMRQGIIHISSSMIQDNIVISINDNGPGIRSEKFQYLFERYTRTSNDDFKGEHGLGIGLSISKDIIEAHGGHIGFDSEIGVGTTFHITIPNSSNFEMNTINKSQITNKQQPTKYPVRLNKEINDNYIKILSVDDEPVNNLVLEHMLDIKKYKLYPFCSAENIINNIENIKPDIIFMDLKMPYISGIEACEIIREKYSIYELPIIMLTALSKSTNIDHCFKSGCNDYLIKPINKEELTTRLNYQISLKCNYLLDRDLDEYLKSMKSTNHNMNKELSFSNPNTDRLGAFIYIDPSLNTLNKIKQIIENNNIEEINWPQIITEKLISYGLTKRESDVLTLIMKGYINSEIAMELQISLSTVKKHIYSIFNKVGVDNRTQLFSILFTSEFFNEIFILKE